MVFAVLAAFVVQAAEPETRSAEILPAVAEALQAPKPAETPAESVRRIPVEDVPAAEPRRLSERAESGPSLGGFVVASVAVVLLLGGAFWLLRRYGASSRLLGAGGPVQVLGRRPLGVRQELWVVAVGRRALVLGSTSSGLSTLAEITNPDELAALRAEAPERRADSERKAFADSLRREMKGEPLPAPAAGAEDRAFETIAQELAEIRKTVHAWKA
jgi:flagellar biosynthetic protein FliO